MTRRDNFAVALADINKQVRSLALMKAQIGLLLQIDDEFGAVLGRQGSLLVYCRLRCRGSLLLLKLCWHLESRCWLCGPLLGTNKFFKRCGCRRLQERLDHALRLVHILMAPLNVLHRDKRIVLFLT